MAHSTRDHLIQRGHRLAWLVLVALLMASWPWIQSLAPSTRIGLLAALVALLGLPHGAMDPLVARAAGRWQNGRQLALHLGAYVGLAAAVVLLWWLFPVSSLVGFLLISAWHFGNDWPRLPGNRPARSWERGLAGLGVVGAPVVFYPDRVAELFALLTTQNATAEPILLLIASCRALGVAGLIGLAWLAAIHGPRRPAGMLEPVALILAAWWFPPLVYFAVYFCFLHSPRHLISVARDPRIGLSPTAAAVIAALTLLTILLGSAAFWLLGDAQPAETRTLQVVFVSLAALTVPHMMLVERFTSRRQAD